MNAHVIKWIRWQHWLSVQTHRPLAQLYWSTQYKFETEGYPE